MKELFKQYILGQFLEIPACVYIALVLSIAGSAVFIFSIKRFNNRKRNFCFLLLLEYVVLIYCSTVFFRPYIQNPEHNLTPFWSYSEIKDGLECLIPVVVMNVVMFVPIGFLGCVLIDHNTWFYVMLLGLGISISIELLQFVYSRGSSEFDDVLHNAIGCLLGILFFTLIKDIWGYFVNRRKHCQMAECIE